MNIIFYVKIEDAVCSAKVTPINHPYHHSCHVLFSTGYENIFFTDPETGNWLEEDLGETELAFEVGAALSVLEVIKMPSRPLKSLYWCKAIVADRIICFGFHSYLDNNDTVFDVYGSNRKFFYQFRTNNSCWYIFNDDKLIKESDYDDPIKIILGIFKELESIDKH